MTSHQHQDWINKGRPDEGLANPLRQLEAVLRAHGYTVYDKPDASHMDAQPPEDHTDYSETGWPNGNTKWKRWAIDIMPPTAGQVSRVDGLKLPTLPTLGHQLRSDRDAFDVGMIWLKYMNYGPFSDQTAVHVSWYGDHVRGSESASSDAGHIHLSARTDGWSYDIGTYDPVSRLRGTKDMDLNGQDIVPGTTNGQVLRDIWEWSALTADPATPATGRSGDRFHFPPTLLTSAATMTAALASVATAVATLGTTAEGLTTDQAADLHTVAEDLRKLTAS